MDYSIMEVHVHSFYHSVNFCHFFGISKRPTLMYFHCFAKQIIKSTAFMESGQNNENRGSSEWRIHA